MRTILFPLLLFALLGCEQETLPDLIAPSSTYFPPNNTQTWNRTTPDSLRWNTAELENLYTYLEANNTRAFLLLKDGKIVLEQYWGRNILNTANFDRNSIWYWASAGKTLTAFLTGIAQEKGLLDIEDKSSDYLGVGWTNLAREKEDLITIKHQLTMTTGLDFTVSNLDCTDKECLQYRADAGTQWFYHNAPYTLLARVVGNASELSYDRFTDEYVEEKIGMNGEWRNIDYNNVYWSTARDAARFGLLVLNEGKWGDQTLLADTDYLEQMINSSQELNPSYGYLWWLNGKERTILPGSPIPFNTAISPSAPADLFAAMGKNGQFIDVVPSEDLVVVRMGQAPSNELVPIKFHDEMWEQLMQIIKE
ncbi:MAG: serine hydrolase domain-containing protein [Bacteroidota bacterium]